MHTLNDNEYRIFTGIASMSDVDLKDFLSKVLNKRYDKVIETAHYILAEGNIPIALVAHLDTVFPVRPYEIFYDRQKNVIWSPQGLGADDRAGVYSILKIIRLGFRPHIIFTMGEEKGGIGAGQLAKLECPFKDLRYMVELDRQGTNDCVFYSCGNEEFEEYIESFGFVTDYGTYSDISDLSPAWKTAAVNLSIGYRDEHYSNEILKVESMLSTINKVINMLQEEEIPERFIYIEDRSYYGFYTKIWGGSGRLDKEVVKCEKCGSYTLEEDTLPIMTQDNKTKKYCLDCLADLAWCDECGRPFEKVSIEQKSKGVCPECIQMKHSQK